MKKLLCSVVILMLILGLTACPSPGPEPSPGKTTGSNSLSSEELNALLKQYYKEKNYAMALSAADKLLEVDPDNADIYTIKAELLVLIMRDAQDSLNNTLELGMGKADSPSSYMEYIEKIYREADLRLIIPFVPDYTSEDEINKVGNTCGNLYATVWTSDRGENDSTLKGVFASQSGWVYYSDYNENFTLKKMRNDGQNKQIISEDGACHINVIGDWIYFCNISDNNTLYKIRTDGSLKTKISEDRCGALCVSEDWLYYCNSGENGSIYKIRADGSGRTELGAQAVSLYIDGEWLYFSSEDEKSTMRMRLDGSDKQSLINGQWHTLTYLYDGWMYYLTDNNGLVIMKQKPDGSEKSIVWRYEAKINFFTLINNRLVAAIRSHDKIESIVAFDLTAMNQPLKIDNASTEAICTAGDNTIYFANASDQYTWYKIDWDKSAADKIE